MELGYLLRLDLRTAGRVSFAERGRPAGQFETEREALERAANALDDLARNQSLSLEFRQAIAVSAVYLMRAGY